MTLETCRHHGTALTRAYNLSTGLPTGDPYCPYCRRDAAPKPDPAPLVEVLNAQCATCIFLPGNLMRLRRGRVAGMVRDCPCHETMTLDDDGEPVGLGPMCRGFYDAHGAASQLLRIAERLDGVRFVDAP